MFLWISTILFAKQNVIHPSIITPNNFRNELLNVKLNGNIEFPIQLNDLSNVYKFFQFAI